uniref:uncharacterized protein LOC120331098 isoform X1 n=1 Tax=Styela clava TaxID=7725 RepID=UPI001939E6E0|nr:uncharacterized protein LOC120331098 isoform X1 [Styela clava]
MATGKTDQRDDDDNAKLIIIPVILASVFFALTVLLLLFCGIRINQQRVEQESIKLQQLQKKSGSGTDSRKCNNNIITNIHSQQIDETYAEIGPMLPLRNPNMKPQEEQRYETPMRMQYGRNQDIIHSEANLQSTTPNKVYKNAEENSRQNAAEDDISRQNGSEIPGENLAGPYTVMNGSTYELNTVNNVLYNM